MPNKNLTHITIGATTYDIKDSVARAAMAKAMTFLGVTTTAIADGDAAKNLTIGSTIINGSDIAAGDTVIYGNKEFVFSDADSKFHEFGDTTNLGALAAKDSASTTYQPTGTVSQPTFTGDSDTITSDDYTPAGDVSTPTITVTLDTSTSVTGVSDVGTLPSMTSDPSLVDTYDDATETLTLTFSAGVFNPGSLPTLQSPVNVATGVTSATSTQPTFTGTKANITATYQPTGTVSQPTFTGDSGTITVQ